MNKKAFSYLAASLLALVVAGSASAQAWRGTGRLAGVVTDPSGKPVAGAKVTLVWTRDSNAAGPAPIVTNKNGKWVAGGLALGGWNIDVEAPGFELRQMSASVTGQLQAEMKIVIDPKPVEEPKPAPVEEKETLQVGGVEISPEVAAAIEAANTFMKAEKWAEAAAEYEKAVAALPENMQLKAAMSRAYYGAGNKKKAIENLRIVHQADTGNVIYATLLADMLLEDGQLDEGQKVLAALPPGALSDPNTIINLGIRFVNNEKPEEAHKYFSDAVAVDPNFAPAYYYRGIAALQLKKMKEARADLQKVIEIAPDSAEAKDAKDLLAQMK